MEETKDKDGEGSAVVIECAICLQNCVYPVQLPCKHIFCYLCVKGVTLQSKKCAMCRREIPQDYLFNPELINQGEGEGFEAEFLWFYEGRNGWWAYDQRTSIEIENHQKAGDERCELLIAGFLYIIDFEHMLQYRRNDPSRRRKVKRDVATGPKKGVAGLRIGVEADPQNSTSGQGQGSQSTADQSSQSTADQGSQSTSSDLGSQSTAGRVQQRSLSASDSVQDIPAITDSTDTRQRSTATVQPDNTASRRLRSTSLGQEPDVEVDQSPELLYRLRVQSQAQSQISAPSLPDVRRRNGSRGSESTGASVHSTSLLSRSSVSTDPPVHSTSVLSRSSVSTDISENSTSVLSRSSVSTDPPVHSTSVLANIEDISEQMLDLAMDDANESLEF